MCGICGVLATTGSLTIPNNAPERMVGVLSHRGPDEFGAWRDDMVLLGHARLSIIDLASGQQPLCNETGDIWITFNGEIFNYPELREELLGLGHAFRTRSDTETIVHAYEQWGQDCVEHFNGQFAFAIWDRPQRRLFLARDRFGIRPLFLAEHDGKILFGSEIKALLAWPGFRSHLDPAALAEVLTYWVNIPPRTPFTGIAQLPAGHTATIEVASAGSGLAASDHSAPAPIPAGVRLRRYWRPDFLPAADDHRFVPRAEKQRLAEQLREALVEAAVIRLRADVPVGAYLSGGLDSSTTAALIHTYTDHQLKTFSVGFTDPEFDETKWQYAMAERLGTEHRTVTVDGADIAGSFPSVVWHAETPILRTAPTPLYALSGLVRSENYKVVLTGEGADEVLVGYNIFREAKVRQFWSREPGSARRPLLLTRLYPYLAQSPPAFLQRFYGVGLEHPDDPFFSHRPRWQNTGMMATFLQPEAGESLAAETPEARLAASLPEEFSRWGVVARAQYLEMTLFLSGYLLSSQGDRMLMGHSVEGRFPFLDHRLTELAAGLPASVKLESLVEKSLLKASVADLLPSSIVERPKQPYRAPDSASFQSGIGPDLVEDLLGEAGLKSTSLWQAERVAALLRKWRAGRLTSARENMAFVGMCSSQILARKFGPELESTIQAVALGPGMLVWRNCPAGSPECPECPESPESPDNS
ncbi:MAG: asparagine synthase (glutamine-hydrolyzing) [bacterium]